MTELTDKQIEMLYEMAEIHFKWFQIYSPDSETTFEDVLELNHIKMMSIVEACSDSSDDIIQIIFESIIEDYRKLLEDYETK